MINFIDFADVYFFFVPFCFKFYFSSHMENYFLGCFFSFVFILEKIVPLNHNKFIQKSSGKKMHISNWMYWYVLISWILWINSNSSIDNRCIGLSHIINFNKICIISSFILLNSESTVDLLLLLLLPLFLPPNFVITNWFDFLINKTDIRR